MFYLFLPIPGIGSLSPALTKQLIGAGIGLAAGQKPVDVAKNMALQAATSGIASSLSGGKYGDSFKQQLGLADTGGQDQSFMQKICYRGGFVFKTNI